MKFHPCKYRCEALGRHPLPHKPFATTASWLYLKKKKKKKKFLPQMKLIKFDHLQNKLIDIYIFP
jgi:hypothetical protein